jgi:hypothetical protein
MSHIPNSAMPHAHDTSDTSAQESSGFDWRSYAEPAREYADRAVSFVRSRPLEAAGAGAALLAGLAFAAWRSSRRGRFGMA